MTLRGLVHGCLSGLRALLFVYFAAVAGLLAADLLRQTAHLDIYHSDFRAFYSGAELLRQSPQTLYDHDAQLAVQQQLFPAAPRWSPLTPELAGKTAPYWLMPFVNPPEFLLPFLPLTALAPPTAFLTAAGLLLGLAVGIGVWGWQRLRHRSAAGIISLAAFVPVYVSIFQTQSSLVTFGLLLVIGALLRRERYFAAGAAAGILCYKPQIAVIALPLLALAYPKIVPGAALTAALSAALNFALVPNLMPAYPAFLAWYQSSHEVLGRVPFNMVSWQGAFTQARLLLSLPAHLAEAGAAVFTALTLGAAAITVFKFRRTQPPDRILSMIVFAIVLGGWHVHFHDAALLIFPLVILSETLSARAWTATAVAAWAVTAIGYYSPFYPRPTPVVPTLGVVLLFVLARYFLFFPAAKPMREESTTA